MTTVSGILEGYDGTPLANTPVDVIPSQVGVVGIGGTSLVRMKMSFITDATGLLDLGDLHPGGYDITATVGDDNRKEAGSLVVKDQPSQTLADALVTKLNEVAWQDPVFVNPVLNGLVSGSAVQSSPTDATAGRLLKVGAFGLGVTGQAPVIANANDPDTPSGFYITTSSTLGSLPFPNGVLTHKSRATGVATQTFAPTSPENAVGQVYERGFIAATGQWSPWRMTYGQGNIVGTVSQTGGVPTGAVIERGANANGEYARFADGTQICWHRLNLGSITVAGSGTLANPYRTLTQDWTYPAGFVTTPLPEVLLTTEFTGTATDVRRASIPSKGPRNNLTQFSIQAWRWSTVSDPDPVDMEMTAIGRWF